MEKAKRGRKPTPLTKMASRKLENAYKETGSMEKVAVMVGVSRVTIDRAYHRQTAAPETIRLILERL